MDKAKTFRLLIDRQNQTGWNEAYFTTHADAQQVYNVLTQSNIETQFQIISFDNTEYKTLFNNNK